MKCVYLARITHQQGNRALAVRTSSTKTLTQKFLKENSIFGVTDHGGMTGDKDSMLMLPVRSSLPQRVHNGPSKLVMLENFCSKRKPDFLRSANIQYVWH